MNKVIFKQFIKYFILSGVAASVNIGTRFVLSTFVKINFFLGVNIAYLIGMIVNFTLNKNLNFPNGPRRYYHEVRTFVAVALGGLLLTNLFASLFSFLLDKMVINIMTRGMKETISHIAAVGLVSIYSFFAHKYFTYRNGLRYALKLIVYYFKTKEKCIN